MMGKKISVTTICLIISSFYCVALADTTIQRSGAAVTFFQTGYEAHSLNSAYSDGILLGDLLTQSKPVYEFYVPGDGLPGTPITSITISIYGSGTITNLVVGNTIIGQISDFYSTTLTGPDVENGLGTYGDAVNGDVFRVYIDVLNALHQYDLEKIEFTYTYSGADNTALGHFHTAYSAYRAISNFKTDIVNGTWGLGVAPTDELIQRAVQKTGAFCQNLLGLDGNIFGAIKSFFNALDSFYSLVNLINQQVDYLLFWGVYPTTGPTLAQIQTACDDAATACANLAIDYQNYGFDGSYSGGEAATILAKIQDAESKLNVLKNRLHNAAQDMYNDGADSAKVAKQSMAPLMRYDPNSITLYDCYLPNLIDDITLQEDQFVTMTIDTSPGDKNLEVNIDSVAYTNSETFIWQSGSSHTIEAPSPQTGSDSKTYGFTNWSDAGAQSHTINPTSDGTITAYYDTTPISPSSFSHSSITNNSITWTWDDNSGDEDGFHGQDSLHELKWTTTSNATSYTETGLNANTQYTRHVHAYNWVGDSGPSNSHSVYTAAKAPGAGPFSNITTNSTQANWTANGNPSGTEYYCENITAGTNSGWITNTYWNSTGLSSATSYTFQVTARNGDGVPTGTTSLGSQMTHYNPVITTITPDFGPSGTYMKIEGQYFYDSGNVKFHGDINGLVLDWNDTVIYCQVPAGVATGDLIVQTTSSSNGKFYTVTEPNIIYIDHNSIPNIENGTLEYPFSTIERGIYVATTGDEVVVAEGTYYENINFDGKKITVTGLNPDDPNIVAATIIDGSQNGSVVTFDSGEDGNSILTGFTITNGNAPNGGGILCSGASPTITKNIVTLNSADMGGGISCLSGSPVITNNIITNNSAHDNGGGIVCYNANVSINDCNVSGYSAGEDGGGVFFIKGTPPSLIIKSSNSPASEGIVYEEDIEAASQALANPNPAQGTLPSGPNVVNGDVGSFDYTPGCLDIRDVANGTIINWDNFDIGSDVMVQFHQLGGVSSTVLNRVQDGNPTGIMGSLLANGGVFVVNPAGLVFGAGATIDGIAQLVASSLNIANNDFINGRYDFAVAGTGNITNNGIIIADDDVILLGKKALNTGTITTSPGGSVVMAAGDRVLLGEPGSKIIIEMSSVASPGDDAGEVINTNTGAISVASGTIVLAAGNIFSAPIDLRVINGIGIVEQSGIIRADGTSSDGGSVTLTAGDQVVLMTDSLTAANAGIDSDAGEVVAFSTDTVMVESGARIEASGGSVPDDDGLVETNVEINGGYFTFAGEIDAFATDSKKGKILVSGLDLTIAEGSIPVEPVENTLYEEWVESMSQFRINLELVARSSNRGNITVEQISDGEITGGNGDITLHAVFNTGGISFVGPDPENPTHAPAILKTDDGGNIFMVAGSGGITTGDVETEYTRTPGQKNKNNAGRIRLLTTNNGAIQTGSIITEGAIVSEISAIASGDLTVNGEVFAYALTTDDPTKPIGFSRVCLVSVNGDVIVDGSSVQGQATVEVVSHGKEEANATIRICAGKDINIENIDTRDGITTTAVISPTEGFWSADSTLLIGAGGNKTGLGIISINGSTSVEDFPISVEAKISGTPPLRVGPEDDIWEETEEIPGYYRKHVQLVINDDVPAPLTAKPAITHCVIKGNSAINGGGIYCENSEPNIVRNTISDCFALFGAGIHSGGSSPKITNNEIFDNISMYGGGGIFCYDGTPLINNNRIAYNYHSGIYSYESAPTVSSSLIAGNEGFLSGGIACDANSAVIIKNNTIVENWGQDSGGIGLNAGSFATVTNCIVWDNFTDTNENQISLFYDEYFTMPTVLDLYYTDIEHDSDSIYLEDSNCILNLGLGNISEYPCFAAPGYWDTNGTPTDHNDDFWVDGDYHLQSEAGRWDPNQNNWVTDVNTSPCIDAGNPGSSLGDEANDANNVRINMGAYGGTAEASKTPVGWSLLADLTNDGTVDFKDFAAQAKDWQSTVIEQPGDLYIDGIVDIADLALLAEDWLKQTSWAGQ